MHDACARADAFCSLGISPPVGDAIPDVLAPVVLHLPARAPHVVQGRQVHQHRRQRVRARVILNYLAFIRDFSGEKSRAFLHFSRLRFCNG